MKKITAFLFISCMLLQQAIACTTFFINKDGEFVFGRNYDWITGAGMVCTNLKGLYKTSLSKEQTIDWISKYGSITFNQYGKEFPTGGMNEKGLVVELMWLNGSVYPAADKRPALNLLQWIQYQLDNNATVEEIIKTDKKIRIAIDNPPCHFLVADVFGNAATIEFINGKLVVHTGKDLRFPVLTNNTYKESVRAADSVAVTKGSDFAFEDYSLQRFATACTMVNDFQQSKINKPVITYAFDILKKVEAPRYTKWSIVYDMKNLKVYFKTDSHPDIKSFSFSAFDLTCSSAAMAVNMNQKGKADISASFKPFTSDLNRSIIEKAASESRALVQVSKEEKESLISYTKTVQCKN
ncbi:MAG: linear amide C-N hydrolase [Ferruginibacter sp.]